MLPHTASSSSSAVLPATGGRLLLDTFFPVSQARRYARNELIVQGGASAKGLHMLEAGRAKMALADSSGRQAVLEILGPGDFVSELELNGGDAYGITIRALGDCAVRHVTSRELRARLQGDPALALLLADGLATRVRNAYARIASLAFLGVYGRVAQALLECAVLRDGVWTVEEGSEEIARRVAASREMVSRVFKDMGERMLIRRERRRTMILDREGLTAAP